MAEPQETALDQVLADHAASVFHSWSAGRGATPLAISRAEGSYVWDYGGRRYLDFSSQLVFTNIGHQHPRVVAAIQEQAATLCTVSPQHANDRRGQAARLISHLAPWHGGKVFFTTGGTEAVEHAVRMARLHTGRLKVLAAYRSYHGATNMSIHLTGDPRRWASDHASAGAVHFFGPFLYRSPFDSTDEDEECRRALDHLEQVVEMEGPSTIAAVILESVVGNPGIIPPPPGYLAGVREICDRHGIVYIADEIMCGFGRAGQWFAVDRWDVVPDLVTFAKGVNSGYVPLGGVAISPGVAATFDDRVYPGGLTYSGHPLACAAAVATIRTMQDEHIVERADRTGREVLGPGLRELAERHPSVGDVRGLGVFWVLELVKDRRTKEPLAPYGGVSESMAALSRACLDRGLVPLVIGNRLHVVPPCTVGPDEVEEGLAILDSALTVTDAACTSVA
jgi:taurine---2-oxoglutarate transaminase